MTTNDIKTLISSDESRTLELKKTTGELKDGMHSACAFLNTEGGWLIFGVTPNSHKIIGQEVTDKTQQEIAQALAGLEPAVDVRPEYIDVPEHPGNKVIAIHFGGWVWGRLPYTFHGCPYYKVESTGFVREEHLEIPAEALREALVNALCHRQYEKYNLTVGIAIYDNRIEIENPGILNPELTVESIKRPHISYPYNPVIADVLFRTTFLENWGSGTGRIIDACRTQQVPEPQWSIHGDFIVVTFPRPNVPQDVPQDIDLDRWIENQIAMRPKITTEELANLSGKTSKTIKRHIAKMPHIKYVGSGYSGHWEITDNSDS